MQIIVVRHGQAEAKKGHRGVDADRPLVARGRRQADRLGTIMGRRRPTRVISSPALRCVQTVQPFAEKHRLALELSRHLSRDAGREAVDLCRQLLVSEADDSTLVLCTHREVMIDLLPYLSNYFGRKLGHRPPGAKGGAWILRVLDGKLEKVDYRPPAA